MTGSPMLAAYDARGGIRYDGSAADALGWLATADSAYSELTALAQQARTVLQHSMARRRSDPAAADHILAIRGALLRIANTRYDARPIFGGSIAIDRAYDESGRYLGDEGTVFRCVGPQAIVRVNQTGTQVFGGGEANLFALLATVALGLRSEPSALRGCLGRLDRAIAAIGTAQETEMTVRRRVQHEQATESTDRARPGIDLADVADPAHWADLAGDASCAHASYQAALQTTATVSQLSLVDFLI